MHGLSTIKSNNEIAVINEHNKLKQNAAANGQSVLVKLDSLGFPDYSETPLVFPTATSLKAHLLATVAVHNQKDWQAYYGRTN
jgi:hypothetical protein